MARVLIVWTLLSLFWGSTWMTIKIGLQDLTPFWLATGRLFLALIPLLWLSFQRRYALPRDPKLWALMALTGILNFSVNHGFVFWAEQHITSALAAVLFTLMPLFGMGISHFYRRTETFSLGKFLGVIMGISGVGIIFWSQIRSSNAVAPLACLAILAAALGVAFSGVLVKAHITGVPTLILTTAQMVAGTFPLLILALCLEPLPDLTAIPLRTWLVMAHLGWLGSSIGFVLSNWLLKTTTVSLTQLVPIAATLVAVILGWFVLQEPIHSSSLLGGMVIFAGLLVVQRYSLKPKHALPILVPQVVPMASKPLNQ